MSLRMINKMGFLLVCLLLSISVYLQVFENILPCPLCTLQRLSFVLLGILFFLSLFFPKKKPYQKILQAFMLLTSLAGLFFAGKNILLQHFPSANQECSPGIQYLLATFPFPEAVEKILAGSSDCSLRGFEFLFLDMAEWAFIWFFFFFLIVIYLLFSKAKY